jgi:hypothetical protein
MRFFKHLHTIGQHRRLVRKYCFKLGLYRQGLSHDLSKYSPAEFLPGVKYYLGMKSPNVAEREDLGYSTAWMHHKGRNRHHFEYWTDYTPGGGPLRGIEMPPRFLAEMFCDRLAASRTYNKEKYNSGMPLEYFWHSKDHLLMHPATREALVKLLTMLRDDGEEKTFTYIRREYLK